MIGLNFISRTFLLLTSLPLFGQGFTTGMELGDNIFREGHHEPIVFNTHGHAGQFVGVNMVGNSVEFKVAEINDDNNILSISRQIDINNIKNSITFGFNDIIAKFTYDPEYVRDYNGAFFIPGITPTNRNLATSNAYSIYYEDPGYTWIDMIDPNGTPGLPSWLGGEDWKGRIADIDEIRCDGYIEFPNEKVGMLVNTWSNITYATNSHVNDHNWLHGTSVDPWDKLYVQICPYSAIKRPGHVEGIPGQMGTDDSSLQPSVVQLPLVQQPVIIARDIPIYSYPGTWVGQVVCQNDPNVGFYCDNVGEYVPDLLGYVQGVQIAFKVSDNASVNAFVLVQAKLPGETTWRTIRDNGNPGYNTWTFKNIYLASYSGGLQSSNIFIQWDGKTTDSKIYSQVEMLACQYRVIAVDQGGNVSSGYQPLPPVGNVSAYISGPSMVTSGVPATYVANLSNTSALPIAYDWFIRYPVGGSNELEDMNINLPPSDYWTPIGTNQSVIKSSIYSYELKVDVTVHDGTKRTASYSVTIPGSFNSGNLNAAYASVLTKPIIIQNTPNPFNPVTQISYAIPFDGNVKLIVHDMLGRIVTTLVEGEKQAGYYLIDWDGSRFGSGVYYYTITVGEFKETRKMVLLK